MNIQKHYAKITVNNVVNMQNFWENVEKMAMAAREGAHKGILPFIGIQRYGGMI